MIKSMYFQSPDEMTVIMNRVHQRGGQPPPDADPDILLGEFCPASTLKLKRTFLTRSKFPNINCHCHLNGILPKDIAPGLAAMDASNTKAIINLDGGLTLDSTRRAIDAFDRAYPERFYTFLNVETYDIDEPDFNAKINARIKASAEYGAKGIKMFKEMGMAVTDAKGALILPDDDRLRVVWEAAAECKLPVLYHIADPYAFFTPFGPANERFEQLRRHPEWRFHEPQYPRFERLMEAMENFLARNSATTFVVPHIASLGEDLPRLSALLDRYPNLNFDLAARMYELARIPFSGRDFLIKYAGRALYGTDGAQLGGAPVYYRILETNDEYFNPRDGSDSMGPDMRYMGYGLNLPDDVLRKIYHGNFERLFTIGGVS